MDSNVSLYILKKALQGEDPRSFICTNTSNNLMQDISALNDSKNLVRITISTDELMLAGIDEITDNDEQITRIKQECLYEHLLITLILKSIFERFPNIEVLGINKNTINDALLLLKNPNNISNNSVLLMRYHLDAFTRYLKETYNLSININIIIKDIPLYLQRIINLYVNDRFSFRTILFTPNEDLITYYDSNGILLENVHDYHRLDLKGISALKKSQNKWDFFILKHYSFNYFL